MSDREQPPTPDRLIDLLDGDHPQEAVGYLHRIGTADPDTRKRVIRAIRGVAEDGTLPVEAFVEPLTAFLTDDDRAVRLTTAKLFVALARAEPTAVVPAVDALAARLADEAEFYYVRARCAETLGYVAVDAPGAVTDPETLADLRVGLSFDEPEVKEKLAKALAHVALGDPARLRHQVSSLADHLDDGNELVRYHLCTALAVVGCAYPAKLAEASDRLSERLDDENPYVRGRAVEALGLLATAKQDVVSPADLDRVETGTDDELPTFVSDRLAFCRRQQATERAGDAPDGIGDPPDEVGTVESIRAGTDDVVAEIRTPDDGVCPNCGLALSDGGPPACPRCGAPR
jgi:hypothetical protein